MVFFCVWGGGRWGCHCISLKPSREFVKDSGIKNWDNQVQSCHLGVIVTLGKLLSSLSLSQLMPGEEYHPPLGAVEGTGHYRAIEHSVE